MCVFTCLLMYVLHADVCSLLLMHVMDMEKVLMEVHKCVLLAADAAINPLQLMHEMDGEGGSFEVHLRCDGACMHVCMYACMHVCVLYVLCALLSSDSQF